MNTKSSIFPRFFGPLYKLQFVDTEAYHLEAFNFSFMFQTLLPFIPDKWRSAAKEHSVIPNEGTGPDVSKSTFAPHFTTWPKNQEVKKILLKNFLILTDDPTTKEINFLTPSLCAFIGGIQVSETSWFIALCRLALTIPKPHQREPFLATDPGAAHATSQEGRQRSATPAEMFG